MHAASEETWRQTNGRGRCNWAAVRQIEPPIISAIGSRKDCGRFVAEAVGCDAAIAVDARAGSKHARITRFDQRKAGR